MYPSINTVKKIISERAYTKPYIWVNISDPNLNYFFLLLKRYYPVDTLRHLSVYKTPIRRCNVLQMLGLEVTSCVYKALSFE